MSDPDRTSAKMYWTRRMVAVAGSSWFGAALFLAGCATPAPPPSTQHLDAPKATTGQVPEFAVATPIPKPPKPTARPELYSVVVHGIEIQDLLFALARDAKLNVDIHPSITGTVSMNALDQTLTEILDRIARQVDMRYEMNGKNLAVTPDSPFLKLYRVDYPNMERRSEGSITTSLGVASGSITSTNSSETTIKNKTNNLFWESLIANLKDLLRETDKVLPEGSSETVTEQKGSQAATPLPSYPVTPAASGSGTNSSSGTTGKAAAAAVPAQLDQQASAVVKKSTYREAASVIANAESGIINVRATQRQHEKIREFLDRIMGNARRQVLIEATIVEVDLNDRFQQGIDWSMLRNIGSLNGSGIVINANSLGATGDTLTGGVVTSPSSFRLNRAAGSGAYTLSSALRLLESFGTLRVLSSPKISVLNSQTSILKVVDNEVYFLISATPPTFENGVQTSPAVYTTTINTVPIGFLMTVTPQISESGEVILNLRPTISRITKTAIDPNPALAPLNITNRIPVVQTREMESLMRVQSGDIAVLGGLIQDTRDRKTDEIPGLSSIPIVSDLFKFQDNKSRKTELVIFIRPTVLTDASLEGDFNSYRAMLPEARSAFTPPADQNRSPAPRR